MDKVLTIVIPTYNMERYLERCLNSLIVSDELMEKLEVLVINDGSKDRSSEIAHSYEEKYPQTFRVIDKENGNYGSCINRGLKEAKGKYIKILDADDWFETKNFEDFIKLLRVINCDGVISDTQKVDLTGRLIKKYSFVFAPNTAYSFDDIMKLPFERIPMHCITYKTDNVRSIGYQQTEGISYTDMEWIFLPMTTCNTIYYFPKIIYNYLVGREGQTMAPDIYKKSFGQEIKVLVSMINSFKLFNSVDTADTQYLLKLLIWHSRNIYLKFFLLFRMQVCNEDMAKADIILCKFIPSVAKELECLYRFQPIKYRYVKWWRKLNYPRTMYAFKLGMKLHDLKSRIKCKVQKHNKFFHRGRLCH